MTTQKTSYTYQDASLVVDFYAENHKEEWSNDRDLRAAIDAVINCAGSWKTFSLTIKANAYREECN